MKKPGMMDEEMGSGPVDARADLALRIGEEILAAFGGAAPMAGPSAHAEPDGDECGGPGDADGDEPASDDGLPLMGGSKPSQSADGMPTKHTMIVIASGKPSRGGKRDSVSGPAAADLVKMLARLRLGDGK